MKRRSLLETVGTTSLLALGVGSAAASGASTDGCDFVCCEKCRVAYCPGGCDCERECEGVRVE